MMTLRSRHLSMALVVLSIGAASCGFGYGIVRPDSRTVVENLGANRYVYRSTRLIQEPARGPAAPVIAIAPRGAHEIGSIEVTVELSGFGPGGLRTNESEFFPRLGEIAGEMGGTHFMVLRSTRDARTSSWITSLTVSVIDASSSSS
jgi:hypothetical protein